MQEIIVYCEHCGRKTYGLVKTLGDPYECPGCYKPALNYITVKQHEKDVREGKIY